MDFKPLNDDHAVEVVLFRVAINRYIDGDDINALVEAHAKIRSDLPAIEITEENNPAVEFAYRRPDGTASWSLRVGATNQIIVECRRYTRWAKVWAAARPFFEFALGELHRREPFECGHPTLTVVDRFDAASDASKIDSLLRPGPMIAEIVFQESPVPKTPIFHSNSGWYESEDDELVLNTLSIAARRDPRFNRSLHANEMRGAVVIEHLQQVRSNSGLPSESLLQHGLKVLDQRMGRLHLRNKQVIGRILTTEMSKKINLEMES